MKKLIFALAAVAAFAPDAMAAQQQPNVIVIILDDLGWGDVSYHMEESGREVDIPTPSIDALVGDGLELRQFYANPDGFQTRAALLTGAAAALRVPGHRQRNRDEDGLPVAEKTLAEALQKLGYGTYLLGNWGLGTDDKYIPTGRGFDHHYGSRGDAVDQYGHCDPRAKLDWYRDDSLDYTDGWAPDLL
jgi:arylsulfatase B